MRLSESKEALFKHSSGSKSELVEDMYRYTSGFPTQDTNRWMLTLQERHILGTEHAKKGCLKT